MSNLKKLLSVILSVMLVITSIITVLPISYAESNTNSDVSNEILDIPEDELNNDTPPKDYYENLNELIPGEDYIEGEMIVKYLPSNNSQTLVDIAENLEMNIEYSLEESNEFDTFGVDESTDEGLYVLSFDEEKSVTDLVQEVSAFDEVEYAQPNYIYKTCEINDTYILDPEDASGLESQQAMLNTLNLGSEPYTGDGVIVAVIDTGIDLSHPALQGCFWNNDGVVGYNTVNPDNYTPITMEDDDIYTDDHGTHVAGIIAMQSNSTYTAKGIAPNAKIMNLQASNDDDNFATTSIVKALELAEANGADIVNMSLGKTSYDHTLYLACNKAARSMVLIAAAGNTGSEQTPHYPAAFSSVIGVMSYGGSSYSGDYPDDIAQNIVDATSFLNANYPTSDTMVLANTSTYDSQMKYYEIVAPGVNICSTKARTDKELSEASFSNFRYVFKSGTSMATPIISGAVALYIEKNPNATPGQVRDAIRNDSGKKVKLFETLENNNRLSSTDLLSNQIDVSHLLSISPNPEIDSSYIHNNDPTYAELCTFIKSQFDDGFEADGNITNEDIRLVSFLYFDSIDTSLGYLKQLAELTNLLGIIIGDPIKNAAHIKNEHVNYIINNNHLEHLDLLGIYHTGISEIDILNTFAPNLTKLTLVQNTGLKTVSDLSTIPNLSYVNLNGNTIVDISFLENMEKIRVLDISENQITDIKHIANLYSLEKLNFSGNHVKDIRNVEELTNLETIKFSNNSITNINPVEHLINLKSISFSNNYITDISVLAGLNKLEEIVGDNNRINNIGDILNIESLSTLFLPNNNLAQQYDVIEQKLNSSEQNGGDLFLFDVSSNIEVIPAKEVIAYDTSFKRTDLYFTPDIRVFPYNATHSKNINLTSSGLTVIVNEYSNTLAYNPSYSYNKSATKFVSTISYSIDEISGSFNVSLLMPSIFSANLEQYNVDGSTNNYISVVTTIDSTKIKLCSSHFDDMIYDLSSENVTYEDYGDERIIRVLLPQSLNIPSDMLIFAGDEFGYFDSEYINDNNTISITASHTKITSIIGTADKLFLMPNGINGINTNAIGNNCHINDLILPTSISYVQSQSFNNCDITNLYFRSKCSGAQANIFNNCNDMTVYISNDSPILSNSNATFFSDYKYSETTISEYCGTKKDITIPKYLKITEINNNAFFNHDKIESVDLSNIKRIGDKAFYDCDKLFKITGVSSIERIGSEAFSNCNQLAEVSGILNTDTINANAFSETAIISICIQPKTSFTFSESVFANCYDLKLVSISDVFSLKLQTNAFKGCEDLEYININSKNFFEINESCFEGCKLLKTFCFDKVSKIHSFAFKNCKNLANEIIFYATELGSEAFYGCHSITSATFMKSCTLGAKAFYNCCLLETIGFISTDNKCGEDSFDECSDNLIIYTNGISLQKSSNNETYTSNVCSDFLISGNQLKNIKLIGYTGQSTQLNIPECLKIYEIGDLSTSDISDIETLYIPDSVKTICRKAFYGCSDLYEIKGCKNVTRIEAQAFYHCQALNDISCFQSVISIGQLAFAYTAIENLDFPFTLTHCNYVAFGGCRQLKSVKFNGALSELKEYLFYNCTNLERCILTPRIKTIEKNVFSESSTLKHLYLPRYLKKIYSNALPSSTILFCEKNAVFINNVPDNFNNSIYPNYKVENGVLLDYQSESGYDYINQNGKRVADIPNVVEKISNSVFFANTNIDIINTTDYLFEIGDYAFMDCSVSEISLPPKMKTIGRSAFNRTGITSIKIPEGITKLEPFFAHCAPLEYVVIPNSVTEICNKAFGDCQKLKSIYIPDSVTAIDPNAFAGATNPITLWGDSNPYLNQYATDNSQQNDNNIIISKLGFDISGNTLNSYTGNDINVQIPIGIGLTNIANNAFQNNTLIEAVAIPSEITSIGSGCFDGCTSLTTIVIPDDVIYIENDTFNDTPNLTVYCNEGSFIKDYCIEHSIGFNTDFNISDGILNSYNGSATNLVIPSNLFITTIGPDAFHSNTNLTSVTIPEGVFKIGTAAFESCTSLSTVTLPATNTIELSPLVFSYCFDLTTVNNSTSISRVSNFAFSDCYSLETIDLSNVKSITQHAFFYCPNLTNITIGTSVTSIRRDAFLDCNNVIINCYSNSYAHQYAIDNDIEYILLDDVTRSVFSLTPSANSHTTNNIFISNIEERTINSPEDEFCLYVQQKYNGKITRNDIDDIRTHMINKGWW